MSVLCRKKGLSSSKKNAAFEKLIWHVTDLVLPEEESGKKIRTHNQAIMELGALICTAGKPRCVMCPISEICAYYAKNPKQMVLNAFFK